MNTSACSFATQNKSSKNSIKTYNVTWDSFDKVYYIVCPECGEYIYYTPRDSNDPPKCNCGYKWRVRHIAIGERYNNDEL